MYSQVVRALNTFQMIPHIAIGSLQASAETKILGITAISQYLRVLLVSKAPNLQ